MPSQPAGGDEARLRAEIQNALDAEHGPISWNGRGPYSRAVTTIIQIVQRERAAVAYPGMVERRYHDPVTTELSAIVLRTPEQWAELDGRSEMERVKR